MSYKSKVSKCRPSDDDGDALVPPPLRVALWIARLLFAAPVRLRREGTNWRLSVSPTLAKLQRLIAAVTCISFLTLAYILLAKDFNHLIAKLSFGKIVNGVDIFLVVLTYVLGVWTFRDKLKLLVNQLRQIHKISCNIYFVSIKNYSKRTKYLIIGFTLWQLVLYYGAGFLWHLSELIINNEVEVISPIFLFIFFYIITTGSLIRLMISAIIFELTYALTLLNDQLEYPLTVPMPLSKDIKVKLHLKELKPQKANIFDRCMKGIHYINQCHGMICDMVEEINDNEGPFLLLSFMFLFLELLIIPQSFIINFESSTLRHIIFQVNRIFLTLSDVMIIVEPCQRLQDQMVRTRSLLGRLQGEDQHCGFDSAQLELFILQAQLRDAGITPVGVITVRRPIVASIIGGVVTILVIVFQIATASKVKM